MGTRYKIVITELCEETKTKGKTWERGAGLANSGREGDYGYTPEIQKVVDVEREIYTQNTEHLDLTAVIMAVNGLANHGATPSAQEALRQRLFKSGGHVDGQESMYRQKID